jgi:hypothetical protein
MGRWQNAFKKMTSDLVTIQFLDGGGNWSVVSQCTPSDPGVIDIQLMQAQKAHPGHRVRAIDPQGHVIDIA